MVYVDFSFYITTIYSTGCVKNMIPIQRSISQNLDKIFTTLKLSLSSRQYNNSHYIDTSLETIYMSW